MILLAVLTLTLQTRTQADLGLLARLTQDFEAQAAKDSLTDRLRTPLAATLTDRTVGRRACRHLASKV